MSGLIYRRAFSDGRSLEELCRGVVPAIGDVRRRVFVMERSYTSAYPDHFLKSYRDKRLENATSIGTFAPEVLYGIAARYLERRNGRIRVQADRFADWHQLVPALSPLAVIVAFLVNEGRWRNIDKNPREFLREEIGDTALLSPYQPVLEDLVERAGLNEMHMHLNGSTEADIIWPDAIMRPNSYLQEFEKAHDEFREETGELFDQIEVGLRPWELCRRFGVIRRMRHAAAQHLRLLVDGHDPKIGSPAMLTERKLLETLDLRVSDGQCEHTLGLPLSRHPAASLFPASATEEPLIDEAVLLHTWLSALSRPATMSTPLGVALYANFLGFTLLARTAIQQVDEVGFDQFQKYTVIGVREHLERKYANRFRQLNVRPPHRVLTHLEGRLSAKATPEKQLKQLDDIVQGFLGFRGCPRRAAVRGLRGAVPPCLLGQCVLGVCDGAGGQGAPAREGRPRGRPEAELSLVVHFIKRRSPPDEIERGHCLDTQLRRSLEHQARCFARTREISRFAKALITGIDAAANELHAAPEVFAPIFRFLRRDGMLRATYHAGEDFRHLVSGIRATAEARRYLDLGPGDRMGHATAIGISPRLWLERIGERTMMPIGDHLDDLVFAHMGLSRLGSPQAQRLLGDIAALSARLYGREQSPALLHQAWTLRRLDILKILALERSASLVPDDPKIGDHARERAIARDGADSRAEHALIADTVRDHPDAYRLFRARHRMARESQRLVECDTAFIDADALSALQVEELRALEAGGVTLETLPTSNLRISYYGSFKEHHLFRWLGLTEDGFDIQPAVCVGSDDTGIFATNLLNEYASILDALCRDYGQPREQAIGIVERLNATGFAHRFRPG